MNVRRILGIDPGSRITGYGIIEHRSDKNTIHCLAGGCIRLQAKDVPRRLGELFAQIQDIVRVHCPTELAIEQVFVHKNANSALKLGQARGVALAAVFSAHIPVFEYAPRKIKQAIVGRGAADKSQVQHMIQVLLSLKEKPQADAADALAVALCHCHSGVLLNRFGDQLLTVRKRSHSRKKWKIYDRTTSRYSD
jgi:crossover junction endodeoxyribonuclease RuvC